MSINVFEFTDHSAYLSAAFQRRRTTKSRPMPLTYWAKRLRYKSARSIAMVLKKQRLPTAEMVQRISEALNHSDTEHRYLELLVRLAKEEKVAAPTDATLRQISALRPKRAATAVMRAEEFSLISDWYYLVLKQLVGSPEFRENPDWILRRLRGKINRVELNTAISTMLRLGVLSRHRQTRRLQVSRDPIATSEDVPCTAIREHHRQMLTRALEALEELSVDKREITSKTLRISPAKMAQAKQEIRRFKQHIEKKFGCDESSSVFQLNIQLFPHTTEDFP